MATKLDRIERIVRTHKSYDYLQKNTCNGHLSGVLFDEVELKCFNDLKEYLAEEIGYLLTVEDSVYEREVITEKQIFKK